MGGDTVRDGTLGVGVVGIGLSRLLTQRLAQVCESELVGYEQPRVQNSGVGKRTLSWEWQFQMAGGQFS